MADLAERSDHVDPVGEGKALYEAALRRAVHAITSSALEGKLGESFRDDGSVNEKFAAARELNARLKDHLRDLNQRAATCGVNVPALRVEERVLLHAMFNSTDDSWEPQAAPQTLTKRAASMSLLKNPIAEKEPEDMLFHFPAMVAPAKGSRVTRCNQSTWTVEDIESDPLETQNCFSAVCRIQRPTSTKPPDPSLLSSPHSVLQFKRLGEEGNIKAHWFWHSNLRNEEKMTPSVVCGCTRSRGIHIKTRDDPNRAQGREAIPLGDVKGITVGMSAAAFRDWCSFKREEGNKLGKESSLQSSSDLAEVDDLYGSLQSVHMRAVRRALTVSLKESRRSSLFGMWYSEVTIIFDTLDGLNAFLASFLHHISYVQWGVDAFAMVEAPHVQPPSLAISIDNAVLSGDIKQEEGELCASRQISPLDYLAVKERVLAPFSPPLMGVEDLFGAAPALDVIQMLCIVRFFEHKGWVALHRLYRCA